MIKNVKVRLLGLGGGLLPLCGLDAFFVLEVVWILKIAAVCCRFFVYAIGFEKSTPVDQLY